MGTVWGKRRWTGHTVWFSYVNSRKLQAKLPIMLGVSSVVARDKGRVEEGQQGGSWRIMVLEEKRPTILTHMLWGW